jgi:hypothetical protein
MSQHEPEWPIVHIAVAVPSCGALKVRHGNRRTSPAGAPPTSSVMLQRPPSSVQTRSDYVGLRATQGCSALRVVFLFDRPAHGGSPRGGRQKFFVSSSFKVALSSNCSASSFFSLRFSSSSDLRRFASDTSSPPYLMGWSAPSPRG